jgi:hypothetical protein
MEVQCSVFEVREACQFAALLRGTFARTLTVLLKYLAVCYPHLNSGERVHTFCMDALEKLKAATRELEAQNAKIRSIIAPVVHTISNLTEAAKYDGNQRIKAHAPNNDSGTPTTVRSRRHSMMVRNIIYGRYFRK